MTSPINYIPGMMAAMPFQQQNLLAAGQPAPDLSLMQNPGANPLTKMYQDTLIQTLSDPKKRAEMMKLVQDTQSGKIQPQEAIVSMARMMQQSMNDSQGMPPVNTAAIIPATLIGLLGAGYFTQRVSNMSSAKNSIIGRFLRRFDRFPVISQINTVLEKTVARPKNIHQDTLLKTIAHESQEISKLRSRFTNSYLGPKGFYNAELLELEKTLGRSLPKSTVKHVVSHLRSQIKYRDLMQLFSPELEHYVPYALSQHLGSSLTGKEIAQSGHTLRYLNGLIVQNGFLETIGQAIYQQRIPFKQAQSLLELVKANRGSHFNDVLENIILKKPEHKKTIYKLFGLKNNSGISAYRQIRNNLNLLPLHEYLNLATKGELFDGAKSIPLNAQAHETLAQIQQRLSRFHISNQLKGLTSWNKFENNMRGLLKRILTFERLYIPFAYAEQNINNRMMNMGIRPIGRFLGKALFYMDRTLEGKSFERWGLHLLTENNWTRYTRLLLPSLLMFGVSVPSLQNTPKEVRLSKLMDTMAMTLGGYYGFVLTPNLMSKFMVLQRLKPIARLAARRLPIQPFGWTYGSLIQSVIAPMIGGWFTSKLFQKPVNLIFGDPAKKEEKLIENTLKKQMGNGSVLPLSIPPQTQVSPNAANSWPIQPPSVQSTQYQNPMARYYSPLYPGQQQQVPSVPAQVQQSLLQQMHQALPPSSSVQQPIAASPLSKQPPTKPKNLVEYDTTGLSAAMLKSAPRDNRDAQEARERRLLKQFQNKFAI